ncbi:hypothetical protein Tsubulata_046514 [Turnera subulata]|uniref:Zinc finger LSD1-type domain-containing protein n=1 Tax=Turnera subulata TaxID=218843 RepID=A0A9Q0J240_9ROSI|nr:hypothetical protein Tsubulata_046514 [Turnera subulata]
MPTNSLTSSSSSSSSSSSASLRSTAHTNPVFPNVISSSAAQSQLVCSGCRTLLLFPVGATSLCCAVCNAMTAVPPPGTEMAQLVCGGCHNLLMHIRGATSVRCSCCHTVNLRLGANQVAHLSCGNCWRLLMYQYGARCVKCAVCNFVTSVGVSTLLSFAFLLSSFFLFHCYFSYR